MFDVQFADDVVVGNVVSVEFIPAAETVAFWALVAFLPSTSVALAAVISAEVELKSGEAGVARDLFAALKASSSTSSTKFLRSLRHSRNMLRQSSPRNELIAIFRKSWTKNVRACTSAIRFRGPSSAENTIVPLPDTSVVALFSIRNHLYRIGGPAPLNPDAVAAPPAPALAEENRLHSQNVSQDKTYPSEDDHSAKTLAAHGDVNATASTFSKMTASPSRKLLYSFPSA
mmetsp:Transcript_4871/g.12050  ORF Transcript_4871/g.12050 Transcript_4871/m.12050 type:complete len:230 (-) Transcript_4871:2003-2692(-)